ncbi:MAG: hypothetical protein RL563_295 [Pseudomonadota bacterium]
MTSSPSLYRQRLKVWLYATTLVALGLGLSNALYVSLENSHLDALIRLAPKKSQESRIVLVDIDEKSLSQLGAWPWSRERLADLLMTLQTHYQAALIGLDIVFPEPKAGDEALKRRLDSNAVVMSQVIDFAKQSLSKSGVLADLADPPGSSNPHLNGTGFIGNSASLLTSHSQVGNITPIIDADGKVRRLYPYACVAQGCTQTLSLRMYQALLGHPAHALHLLPDHLQWDVEGENQSMPLDQDGAMLIPFTVNRGEFLSVSAADVLAKTVPKARIENCILFVGSTALGIGDYVATALDAITPGVEVHMQSLVALLDGVALQPAEPWLIGLALVVLSGLFIFWPFDQGVVLLMISLLLFAGIDIAAFTYSGVYLKMTPVYMEIMVLMVAWLMSRSATLNKQLAVVGHRFSRFLPESLVGKVLSGNLVNPSYEDRQLTVLIADMRGFTAACEGKPPQEVAKLAQRCLEELSRCVYAHQGTIEKYSGDGLMALWGAPQIDDQHALHALQAALDMQRAIQALSAWFDENQFKRLGISIGLNSGEMAVGIFGGQSHLAWTAHGEAFNVASRIEQMTRVLHEELLVGKNTVEYLPKDWFQSKGLHPVKGLTYPLELFTLTINASEVCNPFRTTGQGT